MNEIRFNRFLKKHGAYTAYYNNIRALRDPDFELKYDSIAIFGAFGWNRTLEGPDYWVKLHNLWTEECYRKYKPIDIKNIDVL